LGRKLSLSSSFQSACEERYPACIDYIENMQAKSEEGTSATAEAFAEAVAIMARLRGPDGCPWDREQSFDSIRKYTLEETYEVFDAIERRNWPDLQEELGDLLLQVLFYSQMAAEPGYFSIADVIRGLNRKLIRRHPHVFGDQASVEAGNAVPAGMETTDIDASQVLRNWEQIKKAEKIPSSDSESILDSVPHSFPGLLEASKLGSKAAKVGFDWPSVEGVFEKLDEEIVELHQAILQQVNQESPDKHPIANELGDMLFTVVNLARHLGVDAEMALRHTNRKFRDRFQQMEKSADSPLAEQSPAALESLWAAAKMAETPHRGEKTK
jgi:ATP diphosphatase